MSQKTKDIIFYVLAGIFCALAITGAILEACNIHSLGVSIAIAVVAVALCVFSVVAKLVKLDEKDDTDEKKE